VDQVDGCAAYRTSFADVEIEHTLYVES
jgi:hypothetical protein